VVQHLVDQRTVDVGEPPPAAVHAVRVVAPGPEVTGLVARFGFRGGDTPGALHHALRRESCRARVVAEASLWLRLDQR